ncbi:unnamed protein product [Discosporangium mesarthrocarpum]
MYISLKWIQHLIGFQKLTIQSLINKLILAGFEVENVIPLNNDILLELSLTANRTDSSNIKGLIVEINSLFNLDMFLEVSRSIKLLKSSNNFEKPNFLSQFILENIKYKLYNNYFLFFKKYITWEHFLQKKYFHTRKLKILKKNTTILYHNKSKFIRVKKSPNWIQKRLLTMNFKPVNNIIDTINYILIETGQVFFVYDINKLQKISNSSNFNFNIEFASNNSSFCLSDSKTLKLTEDILIITLNKTIISIAGIIQHFNSFVTNETSKIILQAGLYNAQQIKNSSKILNLKTEYSIKLEKQIDLNLFEQAYIRLIHLFWVQKIKFTQLVKQDFFFKSNEKNDLFYTYIKYFNNKIKISFFKINQLIGPYANMEKLSNFQILRYLKLLNFKIIFKTDQTCHILIPFSRRFDIQREIDIIEEIVRINDFNKFNSLLPHINEVGNITKLEKLKRYLRICLINLGFNESFHSTLTHTNNIYEPKLKNPLLNETSNLRLSLLNKLIKKVSFNQKQSDSGFETFEFGRVYRMLPFKTKSIHELEVVSGIFGSKFFRTNWNTKSSCLNWFEAKGLIEEIFYKLNISTNWVKANFKEITNFHPTRTANLYIKNQFFGTFGQIHPSLAIINNINKKTYLFEFNLKILNDFWQNKTSITYNSYSFYPISSIDLTCIIKNNLIFDKIIKHIYCLGQPLLKSVDLFDYYCQPPIPKGYSSLNFKLQFQVKDRTLTNLEVTKKLEFIITNLEKNYDIKFQS